VKYSWTGAKGEVVLGGAITARVVGFRRTILALNMMDEAKKDSTQCANTQL